MTDRFRARCHVYWFWTPSAALWDFEQFKLILLNINVKLISGFITSIWWTSQDEECVNVHALRPVIQQGIFQPKWKNVICVWIFSPLHLVSPLINVFLQQIKRSLCIVLLIPCFPKNVCWPNCIFLRSNNHALMGAFEQFVIESMMLHLNLELARF